MSLVLLLAGCDGGDPAGRVGSTVVLFATTSDLVPPYGSTPFPGDPWVEPDGRLAAIPGLEQIAPLAATTVVEQLRALDGFSTRPTVEVFLDGPLDEASLPARATDRDAALFVVDAAGSVVPFDFRWDPDALRIAGSPVPGTVLEPGQSYSLVVTDTLRAPDGTLARDADFDRLMRSAESALPARWRSTRAAVDQAIALGVPRKRLLATMRFRVARHRDVLLDARAQLETLAAPTLSFPDPALVFVGPSELDAVLGTPTLAGDGVTELPGWDNPTGMAHASVAAMATGRLTTARFRRQDLAPPDAHSPESGTFELDASGRPVLKDPAFPIPITIAIPNLPMPAEGYPVLLYGHGLGASRQQMTMMMETAARAGFATLAIDASSHGSRFDPTDVRSNYVGVLPSFDGIPDAPDGFGDNEGFTSTLALFHEMLNVLAMRDEIRQTVLDWSQVVRLVRDPSTDLSALLGGAPGTAPKLDGEHIVYFGESFGGVIGGIFATVEPHLNAAVLCVPGGGFIDLSGAYSPTLRGLIELGIPGAYGAVGTMNRFHPILGLGNALLDAADPIVYAPLTLHRTALGTLAGRARDVVVLEAIGDEVLSNVGTEALATAMGLDMVAPSFVDVRGVDLLAGPVSGNVGGRTGLLLQFAPATHGEVWSRTSVVRRLEPFAGEVESWTRLDAPVSITNPVAEVRAMLETLLAQVRADAVLEVTHPAPPVRDFDDDGLLDDVDPTPTGP